MKRSSFHPPQIASILVALPSSLLAQAPPSPHNGTPDNTLELILAIVAGVGSIFAAYLAHRRVENFKKEFLNQLLEHDSIGVIKDRGHFVTEDGLKTGLSPLEAKMAALETENWDLRIELFKVHTVITVTDEQVRAKLLEQAEKMRDSSRRI